MLAFIEGKIVFKSPTAVYIQAGAIGFHLKVSLHTYEQIQNHETCKLYTYLHVKIENQAVGGFVLYGFADEFEKEVFEKLLSVSGIGANTAITMLSTYPAEDIQQAVASENVQLIQSVKGIGPKTAKRLILELKDKIGISSKELENLPNHNTINQQALSALVALGFNKTQAEKAISKVSQQDKPTNLEHLIKACLQIL